MSRNYMLRSPKRSKNEDVAPKEDEECRTPVILQYKMEVIAPLVKPVK
jgi:hypothetical protein